MEYRKVQKTGGASYIVSLPKQWVVKNNLKRGDIVSVEFGKSGELVLMPKTDQAPLHEIILSVRSTEAVEHILRKLIALYLAGYTMIKIITTTLITDTIITAVERFSALVIGVEIVEESTNSIILQDISNTMELPMTRMLNRAYIMTESMVNDAITCFRQYNAELANEVQKRDVQIDRIYWYILKQYNMALQFFHYAQKLDVDIVKASNIKTVVKALERIGDHAENIVSIITQIHQKRINTSERASILKLFSQALQILKAAYTAYVHTNLEAANTVIDQAELFAVTVTAQMRDLEQRSSKSIVYLVMILESLIRIAMYSADISEITINEAAKRPASHTYSTSQL